MTGRQGRGFAALLGLHRTRTGDTRDVDEPRQPVTDKSIPPETVAARERMGRRLALLWLGVFAVAAVVIAVVAWLVA
jgi:hypothetical protein